MKMTFDQWWELQWLDDPSELAQSQMRLAWESAQDHRDNEYAELLPYCYYMDPPDGGNVSIFEQVRRMSEDAAEYRQSAACLARAGASASSASE